MDASSSFQPKNRETYPVLESNPNQNTNERERKIILILIKDKKLLSQAAFLFQALRVNNRAM